MKRTAAMRDVLSALVGAAVASASLLLFARQRDPLPVIDSRREQHAREATDLAQSLSVVDAPARSVAAPEMQPSSVSDASAIDPASDASAPGGADVDALRADLAAARDEGYRLKWQLHECQTPLEAKECRELAREFDECRFPQQTPIGALIRLPEYDELTEKDRREVRYMLEEYPIVLQPGEATWIAERWRLQDWHAYGRDVREAFILFLGPGRVAKEMPADRLAQIREECDENQWLRLFGNR